MSMLIRHFSARNAVISVAAVALLAGAAPAAAQNEGALKAAFEGHRVALRMDMPGSQDGVDLHVDRGTPPIDVSHYQNDLKRFGTAIHVGDSVVVTLVKVKKDLIEFQLAGGGFGTFGDDTSTTSNIKLVEKSEREKTLEKRVKDEDDRDRRRDLQRELDDLRDRRERENRRIMAERERVEEMKRARVAEERLRGGSRFNLKYSDRVPAGIRPEDVMAALAEYVDFRPDMRTETAPAMRAPLPAPLPPPMAPPPAPAGDISLLRKGMSRADAERAFGRPVEATQRRDAGMAVTTLLFASGDQRISADFVEDVLVRYTISSK